MKIKENLQIGLKKANIMIGKMGSFLKYQIVEPHYPLVGVEVTEDALYLMKLKKMKKTWKLTIFDAEPLEEGILRAVPLESNINDLPLVVQHMRALWSRNKMEDKQLSLLVPDKAVIIFIMKLEHTASRKEADRLLQWKLRKSVPFPVEMAKISWMIMSIDPDEKKSNILVALIKKDILEQYEKIATSVDASVALIDTPFFSFYNYLCSAYAGIELREQDFLLINHDINYLTMGLFSGGELNLYKCRSLFHTDSSKADAYKKEILKELHPLVMYYFDQIGGNNLKTVYVKAGQTVLMEIIKDRYGFVVEQPSLKPTITTESSINISHEELDEHVPLAGLLLGRRHA